MNCHYTSLVNLSVLSCFISPHMMVSTVKGLSYNWRGHGLRLNTRGVNLYILLVYETIYTMPSVAF